MDRISTIAGPNMGICLKASTNRAELTRALCMLSQDVQPHLGLLRYGESYKSQGFYKNVWSG